MPELLEFLSNIDPIRVALLIAGSLLAAAVAWFAKKALEYIIEYIRRWWWARSAKHENLGLDCFEYHGVTARIDVMDALLGNLRAGYRDSLIACGTPVPYVPVKDILQNNSDKTLSGLLPAFEANRLRWIEVMQAGRKQIWDYEDLVGFNDISILRDGEDENNKFDIRTARASYLDHRAIVDCFKDMTPAEQAIILKEHRRGSKVFGRQTAISCALITTEGKIIFPKRARSLTSDPGLITCGVNEAMKISDVHQKVALSAPKRAILRGLDEEFGIVQLPPPLLDRIHVWALVLNTVSFEWYFYGTADFRNCGASFTVQQLERNLVTGKARDKFEHESISAINFEMSDILRFVKRYRHEMTEYGASLPIMAALFDGQTPISTFQRIRRKLAGGRRNPVRRMD